jgi:ParB family transcriptional regulator, chromosome partitioning protein
MVGAMPPRKKKPAAASHGLAADEIAAGAPPAEIERLAERVAAVGGTVLSRYREPLGGDWLLLAAVPLDTIAPTRFQRELSDAHVKRLAEVIPKVGRFLDPVVAVTDDASDGFVTPNGMHRLEAMRRLGARAITALIVPDRTIAYRILALNTEKAHNLKDKSLEVVRMADTLAADPALSRQPESTWAFEFEEPAYLTIGRVYLERPRYSGGAYLPVVKRCEAFTELPMAEATAMRAGRAARLRELDDAVAACVAALKAAGLRSPYLKPFVVARLNPLRFVGRGKKPDGPADFDATMDRMLERASKFDAGKIEQSEVASTAYGGGGGGGGDGDED